MEEKTVVTTPMDLTVAKPATTNQMTMMMMIKCKSQLIMPVLKS